MSKILQNAIYIRSQDKFYLSRHVHDFVSYKIGKFEGFIDGGREYFRTSVIPDELKHDVVSYHLMENSPKKLIHEKLLWGTYGPTGNDKLRYVPIKDLEKDHLQAILKLENLYPFHKKLIQEVLKKKK